METIPCPGCRTALEPSATVCPICLRPRGKLEITRAYATMREMEKQRKKRPFIIAGRLLAAAAVAGILFRFRAPILGAVSFTTSRVGSLVDEALYPPAPAPNQSAPPPAQPASPHPASAFTPATSAPSAPSAPSSPSPAATATTAPSKLLHPAHVEDLPIPSIDPGTQWVFYGRIFDLITLLPVAEAQLTFTQPAGVPRALYASARTDAEGRFSAVLSRVRDGESYEIHASRTGYASVALYESDIPYATLPLAERREIVRNAQDGDLTLPPLSDIAGEESIRRDVFLAPRR